MTLYVDTQDAGFVWGQSQWGDTLGSEANAWTNRNAIVHAGSTSRGVATEKAILFRPETPTLSLTLITNESFEATIGKLVRVRDDDTVIFIGEIIKEESNHVATNDGPRFQVKISAVGISKLFNSILLEDSQFPQQTAGNRAQSLLPVSTQAGLIETYGCNRLMAARGQSTVKLMTVLQETADTQLARFYVNRFNKAVLDGNPAPAPTVFFSDDKAVANRTDYTELKFSRSADHVVTAVGVKAKQDENLTAYARHTSALVTNEQEYTVDVPTQQNHIDAWAQSFPLKGDAPRFPVGIRCKWQPSLADLEPTQLVSIQHDGEVYLAGVKTIKYDFKATQNRDVVWGVTLELMPGHLVQFTPVLAPSDVRGFTATAVTDHRIALKWTAPEIPNSLTGYMIRFNVGPTPPVSRTDGTLLVELAANATQYSHTGIASNTQHSYSIWATTANPAISSNVVTAGATTPETIPSAVQGFTAVKNSTVVHTLTWSPPSDPGTDIDHYMVRGNSTMEPTPTGDHLFARVPVGTNSYTTPAGSLGRNQTVQWAVWPVTKLGAVGPAARTSQNTNEVIPSAVTNLTLVANNYNTITASFTPSANTTDLDHYRLVRLENAYRVPGISEHPQYGLLPHQTSLTLSPVGMNAHHDVAVYPITKGGLGGPGANAWTDTPQGIFDRYWEGEATWSQSYRANNNYASFGSGNPEDLYYGYVESSNGNLRSMAGFDIPGNVAGCYAIDRVEVHVYNRHTYYNSGATCWFGAHTSGGKPGTFQQSAGSLWTATMPKPGWVGMEVTGALGGHLSGGARGITLGPGPNNSNQYYGYAAGTPGPRPVMKIWYRTLGG